MPPTAEAGGKGKAHEVTEAGFRIVFQTVNFAVGEEPAAAALAGTAETDQPLQSLFHLLLRYKHKHAQTRQGKDKHIAPPIPFWSTFSHGGWEERPSPGSV